MLGVPFQCSEGCVLWLTVTAVRAVLFGTRASPLIPRKTPSHESVS